MPYQIKGRTVYVKRGKNWVVLKRHQTRAKALSHFRALQVNVRHK